MKVKVIREKFKQNRAEYKRFQSEPKWLIIAGLVITGFSIVALFAAQIIFAILSVVGGLVFFWGVFQWILRLFEGK